LEIESAGHITRIGDTTNAQEVPIGKPQGKTKA